MSEKLCSHREVDDGGTCLICKECGAVCRVNPGLMRAMVTGKQIVGPIIAWSDGQCIWGDERDEG